MFLEKVTSKKISAKNCADEGLEEDLNDNRLGVEIHIQNLEEEEKTNAEQINTESFAKSFVIKRIEPKKSAFIKSNSTDRLLDFNQDYELSKLNEILEGKLSSWAPSGLKTKDFDELLLLMKEHTDRIMRIKSPKKDILWEEKKEKKGKNKMKLLKKIDELHKLVEES